MKDPKPLVERISAAHQVEGLRHLAATLGVGLAAMAAQWAILDRGLVPLDEGHILATVDALESGKQLYRDIYTGITPGIYLLVRTLFATFGSDLLVTRWAACVVNGLIAALIFSISKRVAPTGWALGAASLHMGLVALAYPVLTMLNYSLVTLALALATAHRAIALVESDPFALGSTRGFRLGIEIGLLIGATVWVKQNVGVLVMCIVALTLTVEAIRQRRVRWLATPLLGIASAGAIAAIGLLTLLFTTGTFDDFIRETVTSLVTSQMESFAHPFPSPFSALDLANAQNAFLYTPPFLMSYRIHGGSLGLPLHNDFIADASIRLSYASVLISWGLAAFVLGRAVTRPGSASPAVVVVAALPLGLFLALFPNAIWSHLAFVWPAALPLIAFAAAQVDARLHAHARRAWRSGAAVLASCSLALVVAVSVQVVRWHPIDLEIPRMSVRVSEAQAVWMRWATRFLTECGDPGDAVFTAPDLAILYYSAGRPNPTPYYVTVPGNVDVARLIRDLDASNARCIVYNRNMYPEHPPMRELFPDVLDYIETRFVGVSRVRRGGYDLELRVRFDPLDDPPTGP